MLVTDQKLNSFPNQTPDIAKRQKIKYLEEPNGKIKQTQINSSLNKYKCLIPTITVAQTIQQLINPANIRQSTSSQTKNRINDYILKFKQIPNAEMKLQNRKQQRDRKATDKKLNTDQSEQTAQIKLRGPSKILSVKFMNIKNENSLKQQTGQNTKQYFKDFQRYLKLKAGNKLQRIQEKTEETSLIQKQLPKSSKQFLTSKNSSTDDSERSFKKSPKNNQNSKILSSYKSQILPSIYRSASLPQIQKPSKVNHSPKFLSKNKDQKQQLINFKLKLPSLQRAKPSLKHSTQIIRESNIKSMQMEKKISKCLKDIKKFEQIQKKIETIQTRKTNRKTV